MFGASRKPPLPQQPRPKASAPPRQPPPPHSPPELDDETLDLALSSGLLSPRSTSTAIWVPASPSPSVCPQPSEAESTLFSLEGMETNTDADTRAPSEASSVRRSTLCGKDVERSTESLPMPSPSPVPLPLPPRNGGRGVGGVERPYPIGGEGAGGLLSSSSVVPSPVGVNTVALPDASPEFGSRMRERKRHADMAPSYENTPVRSHTDASFSRPTFLPTGAAHFENSPDLNLDAVLSLLESGDPDFDIDMDTLRSLYDKEGIPYEDDGPSSSAAAANAHPPPQRPAPASPPAEEPPSQTAEPPTHPATPLDGQPAASSNARDPLTIGRLAIWERGREGEHDILRGRRHRLLTGTEESEYEATVTSLSSDRASSTSEETAKHCWVAGGEGDGGGDGDSDGEPPGSLPPPIGIMADEPLSPASRLRVIEEAYFIYCRTGIEDAVANYMDALHVERARRGVRVRPHKRFTERVLERAYMTYIRTGSQDALANYYEALRQEPPSPVPVSIPPSLVVAERAGDGRDDPETTPEPPQHTTLLYLPLYIPTIEVFEQRVLERAYFRWLDTRCQDALHNYCEAFSREVWLLVDSLRSFDPLAFGDHLLDYDNDPIQLTPERISDFKNRVVTRAYFLWLDTMVDDQFYNHALAFRKELGILVEHAVQAQ